jgi:mannose-1-phosphate guanylyltransferase
MVKARRAFVLAAGFGTRLRPLTGELPKPVWPFFEAPLASYLLGALRRAGVEEVIVNQHHLPEALKEALTPWVPAEVRLRWSPEAQILGTGGALRLWREFLGAGPFFLCNADTYQEIDLGELSAFHRAKGGIATLALHRLPPGVPGPIERGPDGRLVRFLEHRLSGAAPGEHCDFTGIHLLEPAVLAELPEGASCINADVHAHLVARGVPIYGYVPAAGSFWSDLGTPERYLEAHFRFLREGRLPRLAPGLRVSGTQHVEGGGAVIGPSYLGCGVRVEEGATAGPLAVLGAHSHVTAGSTVTEAVLWAGARVDPGQALRGAILSNSGRFLARV